MACNLTTGFTVDCREAIGGIKTAYVGRLQDILSITETGGLVSAIAMTGSADFYEYQFRKQTGGVTETIEADDQAGTLFYNQEVNLQFSKADVQKRNEIAILARVDAVVIVEDRNGNYQIYGKKNGMVVTGQKVTGTAMGDFSGYELTFTGMEEEPAAFVSASVISTII